MEKMLATVERLRLREGYTGYIHLKLIPGASLEYIERAVRLAWAAELMRRARAEGRRSVVQLRLLYTLPIYSMAAPSTP
jgi:hypothetical protein